MILILILLLFYLTAQAVWLMIDQVPPLCDNVNYLWAAIAFHDSLYNSSLAISEKLTIAFHLPIVYPPLVPWIAGILPKELLLNSDLAVMVIEGAFVTLLVFSQYLLGRSLFDKPAAMLSIPLLLFSPAIFCFARFFYLDIPLMAMVALTLALLSRNPFSNWQSASLTGIVLGLGLLTKPAFLIFVLGPLLVTLIAHRSLAQLPKWIFSLALALLLALPWYLPNASNTFLRVFGPIALDALPSLSTFFTGNLQFYASVVTPLAGLLTMGGFFVGFALLLYRKRHFTWLFVAAALLIPFFCLSCFPITDTRFLVSVSVVLCLVSGYAISEVVQRIKCSQTAALALVVLLGVGQFLYLSFNLPGFSNRHNPLPGYFTKASKETWKLPELVKTIRSFSQPSGRKIRVVTVGERYIHNASTLAWLLGDPFVASAAHIFSTPQQFLKEIRSADFIVCKTAPVDTAPYQREQEKAAWQEIQSQPEGYRLIWDEKLPDESSIHLYRVVKPPTE